MTRQEPTILALEGEVKMSNVDSIDCFAEPLRFGIPGNGFQNYFNSTAKVLSHLPYPEIEEAANQLYQAAWPKEYCKKKQLRATLEQTSEGPCGRKTKNSESLETG
jgi:hypothetical protein